MRMVEIMAAHSPLSARLAEEAGFDGIWASGFEISALHGLPDASLITMTQHLEITRAMAASVTLPVVADLDTGFGNAITVAHVVSEYERAGVAAVVIEDKTFPKMTSLVSHGRHELTRIAEFQGKIAAAVEVRHDTNLLVIARTEALIAGRGQREALQRMAAYADAGADMVLLHSQATEPTEIEQVLDGWHGSVPVVLVPTSYPAMTVERARALGKVGMIIHGNHAIRAAIAGMQRAFAVIRAAGDTRAAEPDISSLAEVFRLQRMERLRAQEQRYLR